ncbi:hypothetical protein HNP40_000752 [Mycobacteroides chelonae]|nr:hypothetical protein [Mycobacteroides chelonae]
MNELNLIQDEASVDYLATGGNGEYYASHFEDRFVSAAWTCNESGLKMLLGVFESVVESDKATIEACLSDDKFVDRIEFSELPRFIDTHSDAVESVTLRVPDRLFFWSRKTVSSESTNTSLGEIALITDALDTDTLRKVVESSASSAIGKNALELVSYRTRGQSGTSE